MTYNVFSGTLNPTQSINQCDMSTCAELVGMQLVRKLLSNLAQHY